MAPFLLIHYYSKIRVVVLIAKNLIIGVEMVSWGPAGFVLPSSWQCHYQCQCHCQCQWNGNSIGEKKGFFNVFPADS